MCKNAFGVASRCEFKNLWKGAAATVGVGLASPSLALATVFACAASVAVKKFAPEVAKLAAQRLRLKSG